MIRKALIVVDVQNDFVEGGALAVEGGRAMAARIAERGVDDYNAVVFTQDWHIDPDGHFAEPGTDPNYVDTWPVHCVANSGGAAIADELVPLYNRIDAKQGFGSGPTLRTVHKGMFNAGYSAFDTDAKDTSFGEHLTSFLHGWDINDVYVAGIAFDYCVRATALDAIKAGFRTTVMHHLTASVNPANDGAVVAELRAAGVFVAA